MSKRAAALLSEEVSGAEKNVSEKASASALEFFLQKLSKYRRHMKDRPDPGLPDSPPTIDLSSDEAIVESFVSLSKFVRMRGWVTAQGVEETVTDPVARKGLELAIDGWDPMLARQILERIAQAEIQRAERRHAMILEAIDSIVSGDVP